MSTDPRLVGCIGWIGFTLFETSNINIENQRLQNELNMARSTLTQEEANLATLPYEAASMRNVFDVLDSMKSGEVDMLPVLNGLFRSLENDAVILNLDFTTQSEAAGGRRGGGGQAVYIVNVTMKLDSLIATADEAVQVAAALETRVRENFAEGYEVEMTLEPVAAQAEEGLSGGLFSEELDDMSDGQAVTQEAEAFYTGFRIARMGR